MKAENAILLDYSYLNFKTNKKMLKIEIVFGNGLLKFVETYPQ